MGKGPSHYTLEESKLYGWTRRMYTGQGATIDEKSDEYMNTYEYIKGKDKMQA